jgi:methyl-accepting chemotaxis protein
MNFDDDSVEPKIKNRLGLGLEIPVTDSENVPSRTNDSLTVHEEKPKSYIFDTIEEEVDGKKPKKRRRKKQNSNILLYSIVVAIIWIIAAVLVINQTNPSITNSAELAALIVTLIGPAAFAVLAGLMGDILVRSNNNARMLASTTRRLLQPEESLAGSARSAILSIRSEIEKLDDTLGSVSNRLGSLENSISDKTQSLKQVSEDAKSGAFALVDTMENERKRLNNLLEGIAELTRTAQVTTKSAAMGLDEKAQLLVEAAQALARNSDEATQSAQLAADNLDNAVSKAMGAISGLDEASQRGEEALSKAHDLMVMARLKTDNAVDGVSNAASTLNDAAENISSTASKVNDIITINANTARDYGVSAIDEVRAIAEESARKIALALKTEAQKAREIADQSLAALENTTGSIHSLAEQASLAIAEQLENNSRHVENLKQHSFEMNKEADQFVENRLINAKSLINQSANILNETGSQIEARFSNVAKACAEQAQSVETIIDNLNQRLAILPEQAKERADAVESALSDTLNRLNETGRRAVEETHALDAAFQERLKQSYSALGEVVQRLGGLSGVIATPEFIKPPEAHPSVEQVKTTPPVEKKPEDIRPKFGHILSPQTPIRSTPVTHSADEKVEDNKSQAEEASKLNLRGREYFEDIDNKLADENKKPLVVKLEEPAKTDKTEKYIKRDNPFEGINLSDGINSQKSDWNWSDIFSAIDDKNAHTPTTIAELIADKAIIKNINQAELEQITQIYSRERSKAILQVKVSLKENVSVLSAYISAQGDLRAKLIKFVEDNREKAIRGRLSSNEIALIMIAEAVLN